MGAWIEIIAQASEDFLSTVAPLVGAWIEMCEPMTMTFPIYVAPLVGAWIEIRYDLNSSGT